MTTDWMQDTSLHRALVSEYGEPVDHEDRDGVWQSWPARHSINTRKALERHTGRFDDILSRPKPFIRSRPSVTAYEGYEGDAYYHKDGLWMHCVSGEVWSGS